jgi:hypothetical protein
MSTAKTKGYIGQYYILCINKNGEAYMTLTIGTQYKKSYFGIVGSERQWSEITVEGELFSFFSINSKYENSIEDDGFVYEARGK